MPKILFVAAHRPGRSPSQRFRFEQYLPFLKENGYEYDFSYLISEKDDKIFLDCNQQWEYMEYHIVDLFYICVSPCVEISSSNFQIVDLETLLREDIFSKTFLPTTS